MQTDTMNVTGMRCGGCVTKLELALNRIIGVDNVDISLASGEVTVVYDEARTSPSALQAGVIRTGFGVHGVVATNGHDPRPEQCG
jgi:copper chaperone CopZ